MFHYLIFSLNRYSVPVYYTSIIFKLVQLPQLCCGNQINGGKLFYILVE
jgi:hypothetical protein